MNVHVLALDPGLATLGLAVIRLSTASITTWPGLEVEPVIEVLEVLRTTKSPKKAKVLVAHDDVRRVGELLEQIHELVQPYNVVAIAAELPSGSQGARPAMCLGMAKGIVAALKVRYAIPLAACSPKTLKKTVAGSASASKLEVQRGIEQRWPGVMWPRRKTDHEHAADALGAFVACAQSDVIRMACTLARSV